MDIRIPALLALLLLSGFFSGTETAYTSLSLAQIHSLRIHHGRRGRLVAHMVDRPDQLLGTILIGNNLVNIAASAMASAITIELFGRQALGIMTGILTMVILVFGEVTPKQIAISHNEFITLATIPIIYALSVILRPVNWFIGLVSKVVTRLTGRVGRPVPTREGILHLVGHANALGVIENFKYRLVRNVFRFSEVTVHAVMTHRTKVFSRSKDEVIRDAITEIAAASYSRIPVYNGDPERIVGIVLLKDLLRHLELGHDSWALKEIMVEPIFVPETRAVDWMLSQFRREGVNLAVVLDEYGGLSGIVTLEDVIEEILGEIYDEHEAKEAPKVVRVGPRSYRIAGDIPLHELEDALEISLPKIERVQTLGGYLSAYTGHIPAVNETIKTERGEFSVEEVSGTQVTSVLFAPHAAAEPEQDG